MHRHMVTHLRSTQPFVLGLELVHFGVKVVEVPVPEEVVGSKVKLPTGVVE